MSLLIIQPNNTTLEARTWLTNLWRELTELLDPEACVGSINGESIIDTLTAQVEYLSVEEVDALFTYAISTLLDQ